MKFLIDTNIVSQANKPIPDARVLEWMRSVNEGNLFLSAISVEEIREGIQLLPAGKKRQVLDAWLEDGVIDRYGDRIIPIDIDVANRCGRLVGDCRSRGFNVDIRDAMIAATALAHRLAVVTLNRKDFERFGVELVVLQQPH